jgi:hypothetical protein
VLTFPYIASASASGSLADQISQAYFKSRSLFQDKDTFMPVWPPEVELIFVRPYTYYAIFVTTLIVKEVAGSAGIDGAQSDIVYVLSPEDFPSVPFDLKFIKFNYSTINLTWSPPESPNGKIDHYDLIMELKEVSGFCNYMLEIHYLINNL